MQKQTAGFSFPEIMLVLAITGVIAGLCISTFQPDHMYRKYYQSIYKSLRVSVKEVEFSNAADWLLNNNFCLHLSNIFNTIGTVNCMTSTVPNSPNFILTNGMRLYDLQGNTFTSGSRVIRVDINGSKPPNQTSPTDKDIIEFRVYDNGFVEPEGEPETSLIKQIGAT